MTPPPSVKRHRATKHATAAVAHRTRRSAALPAGHAGGLRRRASTGRGGVAGIVLEWMVQGLVERPPALTMGQRLRSLDALHLAAALTLRPDELQFASWDERLSAAAAAEGSRGCVTH